MEDQKRSSIRKLGFIHNMSLTKRYIKGIPYYDLVLPIGENESTKIKGCNQRWYNKVKKLSKKAITSE